MDSYQPPTSFHLFQHLPNELKLIVWEFCLPYRIIDFGIRHDDQPQGFIPPLLSRVCRLSRYIALLGRDEVYLGPARTGFWFNHKTDIISFNRISFTLMGIYTQLIPDRLNELDGPRQLLPYFYLNPLVESHLLNPKVALSIDRRYFGPSPLGPRELEWVAVALRILAIHKECFVTLTRVEARLDRDQACDSDLFGVFAEQVVAYVDIDNPRQMEKLRKALGMNPVRPMPPDSDDEYYASRRWTRDDMDAKMVKVKQDRNLFECRVKSLQESLRSLRRGWPRWTGYAPRFTFVIAVDLVDPTVLPDREIGIDYPRITASREHQSSIRGKA